MANEYSRYPEDLDYEGQGGNLPGLPNKLSSFDLIGSITETISPQAVSIPFIGINPSRVPKQGIVRIDDEILAYQQMDAQPHLDAGTLLLSSAVHRGLEGTLAAQHPTGARVLWLITSVHFKTAYEAIAALEKKVGTTGSEDPESLDFRMRRVEYRLDEGDNAFLADEFVLTQTDLDIRYVQTRQPVKIPSDFMVMVRGGPTQHSGRDVSVSANNSRFVSWEANEDLANLLRPGDIITVVYRAAPLGG